MKKNLITLFTLMLVLTLIFTGCTNNIKNKENSINKEENKIQNDNSKTEDPDYKNKINIDDSNKKTKKINFKNNEEEKMYTTMVEYFMFLQNEDLDNLLTKISKKMKNYDEYKNTKKQFFDNFEVDYEIKSIDILTYDEQNAYIKVIQVITNSKSATKNTTIYDDREIESYYKLIKEGEDWKIIEIKYGNVKFLNNK